MKILMSLCVIAIVFSHCSPSPAMQTTPTSPTKRAMKSNRIMGATEETDSVSLSGVQYVTIEGRNEFGVRPDLEGTWVLNTMPAAADDGKTNTNNITEAKTIAPEVQNAKDYKGNVLDETMKNSKEIRRDTVRTRMKNGTIKTETTVYLINSDEGRGNKITPPQSSNPNLHIPEAPSLQFYGSNDTFSGFTGCNRFSGRYTTTGRNGISFSNAAASTKMACIGQYDENAFLDALRKVNTFKSVTCQLQLMDGQTIIMTFTRK